MKQYSWTLPYVPVEKRTEEICLEAVKENGKVICHVPEEKRTEKICLAAVKSYDYALQFVTGWCGDLQCAG